jgi:hypothetical protein
MTDEHFDEKKAPYNDSDTFIALWNAQTPERRRMNIGLFVGALDREPTEDEIEEGLVARDEGRVESGE